jgi:putative salt-induced outer membrane protein YdiY
VNHLGTNYTWQEAVDNLFILGTIYGWDAALQNYIMSDTLNPGYGYWMYAYGDCDLWITSTPSSTNTTLTTLLVKWNLIGLPSDTPVGINNLIVSLDGTNYTWQEAVDNLFILGTIYGWDTALQNYIISDTLNPGYGYWMYAYYQCILKRDVG